ncbi:MAG: ribosome-associated translation inhibitor RaiA [Candidatus Omnitrophota bacterium]
MNIIITGRNVDLDGALKRYISRKMGRLEHRRLRIPECDVVMEEVKSMMNIEVILHLGRNKIVAMESSPDIYASVDNVYENLKEQLRRLRDKMFSSRRRRFIFGREKKEKIFSKDVEKISKMNFFADKPMLPEEARLELELLGKEFIMFKNADTGAANVLYKKNDGAFGLIEPTF